MIVPADDADAMAPELADSAVHADGAPGAVLVIVSGPSGVGKDSVIEALRAEPRVPDYHYVVTCTTRPRRSYEVDGVHYRFLPRVVCGPPGRR